MHKLCLLSRAAKQLFTSLLIRDVHANGRIGLRKVRLDEVSSLVDITLRICGFVKRNLMYECQVGFGAGYRSNFNLGAYKLSVLPSGMAGTPLPL